MEISVSITDCVLAAKVEITVVGCVDVTSLAYVTSRVEAG